MGIVIELERAHGYIILLVILVGFINAWMGHGVVNARKKYGIAYPQMYAEQSDKNAKAFNCVQRAHQNCVENYAVFFALFFISSILRPQLAAIAGLIRAVGYIIYFISYSSGDPKKRVRGAVGYIGILMMIGLSIEVAIKLLLNY